MRALTATPWGRVQLCLSALLITVITLNIVALNGIGDPSLGTSLLKNSMLPLLVVCVSLGFKARNDFIARDRLAVALAMLTALIGTAQGVAVDRHLGYYDTLAPFELPLLGVTVLAVIWSALGRSQPDR